MWFLSWWSIYLDSHILVFHKVQNSSYNIFHQRNFNLVIVASVCGKTTAVLIKIALQLAILKSCLRADKIVNVTTNVTKRNGGIVLKSTMRKLGLWGWSSPAVFDCFQTKESQDFLMIRMGSSQQIDLQRGTVYSLEMSWT